jgi:hypothetical protein
MSDETLAPLDISSIAKLDIGALTASIAPLTTDQISSLYHSNTMSGYPGSLHSYGNVTINSGSGSAITNPYIYSNNTFSTALPQWSTISSTSNFNVQGDANFESDIKWKGRSLGKLLEKIEDRLAILQEPDPEKLEKFAALKKAYDHYKTLERLIGDE